MADDKVIDLGDEHGTAGPLTYVALLGAAKLQDEDGRVRMGWRQITRGAFLSSVDQARVIIAAAADVGLIEIIEDGPRAFVVQMVGWSDFQRPADPTAAARMRNYRERQKAAGHETRALTTKQRAAIIKRDGGRCLKCESTDELTVDHIVPRSQGGTNDFTNLQTLCAACNRAKWTQTEDHRSPNDRNDNRNGDEHSDCSPPTVDIGQKTTRDERLLQPPGASAPPADDVLIEHGLEVSPHPAFVPVMEIVRDVAAKRPDVSALVDDAVLRTILAHPRGDHVAAAHTAAADLITGRRTTCHFHKAFGDALRDQTGQTGQTGQRRGLTYSPPKPWAGALKDVVPGGTL